MCLVNANHYFFRFIFKMFVRKSKFKHIMGKPNKKEFCYEDIRITKSSWDSHFCSVNPKYIAIITEAAGGGAFLVIPIEKVCWLMAYASHTGDVCLSSFILCSTVASSEMHR